MATTEWIESASLPPRRPVGGSNLTMVSALLSMPANERTAEQKRLRELKDARDQQRAVRCVRRVANGDAALVLEALGLADAPEPEPPQDVTEKPCTRCGDPQPLDQFVHQIGGTDGGRRVTNQCSTCRERYHTPRGTRKKAGR